MIDTPALAAFRQEVRAWAEANKPAEEADGEEKRSHRMRRLLEQYRPKLREAGYLVPHWPEEFGGAELSGAEQVVLKQELARVGIPAFGGIGMHHAAATIMVHGTPEQHKRLPAILDGELWCQGFSEPNAGSDLASLQCQALREGDEYVMNGQKIWSSGAQHASWCLLLARTDADAPKHKGISVFMVEMSSPGIDVRPIRQATGDTEFCEIFFTDVRVPVAHRIGPENEGWAISQTTLTNERGSYIVDRHADLVRIIGALVEEATVTPIGDGRMALEDGGIRQELAERAAEVEVLGMLSERFLTQLFHHGDMGPESSIFKLFYSEILQRLTSFGTRMRGVAATVEPRRGASSANRSGATLLEHVGSWAWTIAAGSSEIQRNIIGERLLGLPREPSPAASKATNGATPLTS
jgi:alkylation response protein AidB-like acyl-CoA dehydrogenase